MPLLAEQPAALLCKSLVAGQLFIFGGKNHMRLGWARDQKKDGGVLRRKRQRAGPAGQRRQPSLMTWPPPPVDHPKMSHEGGCRIQRKGTLRHTGPCLI